MVSLSDTSEPGGLRQICRLCLSEESLHAVWDKKDLQQWISEYLSITVSTGDRISQFICTICQIRLTEFHHFRISCQDVQSVLQSMLDDEAMKREEISLKSAVQELQPEKSESETGIRLDSDYAEDVPDSIEKHAKIYYEGMEDEQFEDQLVIEEIKIESRSLSVDSSSVVAENDNVTKGHLLLQCDTCHMPFPSKWKLDYHKKAGHCTKVNFRANLMWHLKNEEHLHNANQTRPKSDDTIKFKCDDCQSPFPSKSRLNQHKKQSHGDQVQQSVYNADRPFKCDQCQRAFVQRKALNWHSKVVHGPKAFKCSMCHYTCTYISNLNRHMQRHSKRNLTRQLLSS